MRVTNNRRIFWGVRTPLPPPICAYPLQNVFLPHLEEFASPRNLKFIGLNDMIEIRILNFQFKIFHFSWGLRPLAPNPVPTRKCAPRPLLQLVRQRYAAPHSPPPEFSRAKSQNPFKEFRFLVLDASSFFFFLLVLQSKQGRRKQGGAGGCAPPNIL